MYFTNKKKYIFGSFQAKTTLKRNLAYNSLSNGIEEIYFSCIIDLLGECNTTYSKFQNVTRKIKMRYIYKQIK